MPGTLSPIIMEVEHGYILKVATIGDTPIFDFHDYGRKGNQLSFWELSHTVLGGSSHLDPWGVVHPDPWGK